MPGLRSEQEILKAFENLEYVPGSKKKRVDESEIVATRKKQIVGDYDNGWDENPMLKTLNGKQVEMFTIGAFSRALEKEIVTIRLWEKKGFIPSAPYRLRSKVLNGKKVLGPRAYTRPLIEIAIEEFARRGLLSVPRVEWKHHQDLTDAIVRRWKEVVETESQKAP